MASSTLARISRSDLQNLKTPSFSASITEVKHLSSYNWIEESTPTIVVPGIPALWSPPSGPQKLRKDSGLIYIAQNAARHPISPFEPLFRALYTSKPSFDIRLTDLVTDRNNVRKLLSFVTGRVGSGYSIESFAINIEAVKSTVLLCRTETATSEFIGSDDFRGYGHEFKKVYTKSQVKNGTGHHRIISYRFANLNLIVRHETDGFVEDRSRKQTFNSTSHGIDSLSSALGSLSLGASYTNLKTVSAPGSKLKVGQDGQVVPLESTIVIKTRVAHKPLSITDVAHQLWVSQTPKLVRAYHRGGIFQQPQVEDVAPLIKSWEESNQTDLRKLAALMEEIITIAQEHKKRITLRYEPIRDELVFSESKDPKMLPDDLYSKWDGKESAETKNEINVDVKAFSLQEAQTEAPKELMQTQPTAAIDRTAIKIGDVDYNLDVSKIPYLASYTKQQTKKDGTAVVVHDIIPLFDVALKGLESGYRQCFRSLPADLSQHRILCETYRFLEINVLNGMSLDALTANLKVGRTDSYVDYGERPLRGNKEMARDTAFQFLYFILFGTLENETKNAPKLYNAVFFVISHPGTFKYKAKRMIRSAYEGRFGVTMKQRAKLDEWEKKGGFIDEDDATTQDDYDYDFYDSDHSF